MICEAHLPTVSEDDLADAQVYKGLTEKNDLGHYGNLGGAFTEKIQRAVGMTRTGDTRQRVDQVKTSFLYVFHERNWASEL